MLYRRPGHSKWYAKLRLNGRTRYLAMGESDRRRAGHLDRCRLMLLTGLRLEELHRLKPTWVVPTLPPAFLTYAGASDLVAAQALGGHQNVATTGLYLRTTEDRAVETTKAAKCRLGVVAIASTQRDNIKNNNNIHDAPVAHSDRAPAF
jgi:hypothetical protein